MSDFRIIYPNDEGGVSIIVPAPGVSLEQAMKALPPGKPHKIVKPEDVPTDRTFRDAWEYQA